MSLTIKTLRDELEELSEATEAVDKELAAAGDLPPECLAETLLLVRQVWKKLMQAADEVREKSAPLFAGQGEGGPPEPDRAGEDSAGGGKPRRRKKGGEA